MKTYCEHCRESVSYLVKTKNEGKLIRNQSINYEKKIAFCDQCGEEIFVSELRDHNLDALDQAYRVVQNLIQISDIEKILEKYEIGKRPLSVLLGWGDITITRYLDGDIPTRAYSDILTRILNEPKYYLSLLKSNKDRISLTAYRKSIRAVDALLNESNSLETTIGAIVEYIISKSSEITPLALQKLLYYAQGFYTAFTGEYLFEDNCEAWIHGPVYRDVYDRYKSYGYYCIEESPSAMSVTLPDDQEKLIDEILYDFGCFSGKILESMTHLEKPWLEAREGLPENVNSNHVIPKEMIRNYFIEIKTKYQMKDYSNIKSYAMDMFSHVHQ